MEKLGKDKWYSAYNLHCRISTLNALAAKGIVKSRSSIGSLFSPSTDIYFQLK